MLATSTANDLFSQFGAVSASIFSSLSAWLYLIAGIMVAWFIIESLSLIFGDTRKRNARLEKLEKKK